MSVNKDEKYLRMTLNERIQHFLLFTSFITLVITGFALKYPEAFWIKWVYAIFGDGAASWRGIIHRTAAVIMVYASMHHVVYVIFFKKGRQLIADLMFRKQDIIDVFKYMNYLIRKDAEKPKFGRFCYIEKAEYWALVWGNIVMGTTGVLLWFQNKFLPVIGTSGMEIATVVHFYEAVLATLAIIVWHFYFIFISPDFFPMNKAWYTGFITRKQMEHEHPLELEKLEGEN